MKWQTLLAVMLFSVEKEVLPVHSRGNKTRTPLLINPAQAFSRETQTTETDTSNQT